MNNFTTREKWFTLIEYSIRIVIVSVKYLQ